MPEKTITTEQTVVDELSPEAQNIQTVLQAVKENPELANDPEIQAVLNMSKTATKDESTETPGDETDEDTESVEDDKPAEDGETEEQPLYKVNGKEVTDKEVLTEMEKSEADRGAIEIHNDEKLEAKLKVIGGKAEEDTTEKKEAKKDKSDKSDKKDAKEEKSTFFTKQKEVEKVDFKNLDEASSHIKEKYSIDNMSKFFNVVDGWRNDAQDKTKAQDQLEDIESTFEKMPEPLFNAFTAWSNGKDWAATLEHVGTLDYKTDFTDYETYDIVNHYFPGEFSPEDFTDKEKSDDPTVKRSIKMAETQYNNDKEAFENQRADILGQAEDKQKLLKTSASSSVDKLKETFPTFDNEALKKVKNVMTGDGLSGLFFKKDGSYTDDAATKIALVLFGQEEIGKVEKRLSKSQEALKDTVSKGADKPSIRQSQSQQVAMPKEVESIFADVIEKRYY